MKERAFELANQWANDSYIDETDREKLKQLIADEASSDEIVESFYKDIEFGTGGLRAILGIGTNRINKYTVRKAAQAMVNTLRDQQSDGGVAAVCFDCRNQSKEFSREVASVFAANGLTVHIFENLAPTPMLSFAVRYYQANLGVMITASHNPKQYNGFKAYWSDGSQVTPPEDQMIINHYNKIDQWNQIQVGDFEQLMHEAKIKWVEDECYQSFYRTVSENIIDPKMCQEHGSKAHIIYTPLHGTGYVPCQKASLDMGFSRFEIVQSQAEFDSNFSTIETTPNPEDPKALALAVAVMLEENADVAYGTDPDGDRLGVVVNNRGVAEYLNGNQIALLMLHYVLKRRSEMGTLPSNPLVLKSIVTSPMQNTIAEKFNTTVMNTLTGFKWMAKKWRELETSSDYNFLFASEESFGYMPHNIVRDKDAVASIALMNEVVLFYKLQGKTLLNGLDDIYDEFGYGQESLIAKTYEGLSGKEKIDRIMQYFRDNWNQSIAGLKIAQFSDYQSLEQTDIISGEKSKIDMTASNVLSFVFESGDQLFLRPSGTEPKIKFYTMVQVKEGSLVEKKEQAQKTIEEIEAFIHQTIEDI